MSFQTEQTVNRKRSGFRAARDRPVIAIETHEAVGTPPSSIYSWSIGHILKLEFCLGHLGSQGSRGKKSGSEEFCENFEGGFFNFWWSKQHFKDF